MTLDGQTTGEARVVRAHLDHNLPPTGESHTDDFGEVPRAEQHGPQSVLQVLVAPLAERRVVDHDWQYPDSSPAKHSHAAVRGSAHADQPTLAAHAAMGSHERLGAVVRMRALAQGALQLLPRVAGASCILCIEDAVVHRLANDEVEDE